MVGHIGEILLIAVGVIDVGHLCGERLLPLLCGYVHGHQLIQNTDDEKKNEQYSCRHICFLF